jgi:iron complex outermembrane receptor protein
MTSIQRSTRLASRSSVFKLAPVAAGCAALLLATGSAYAQTAAADTSTLNTVTVTGIRKGIEDAISVKKNSDAIIESISAEDIGKLPDSTMADSLARLPGVTTQRTKSGTASTISIRGLGPDFNGYLLNGREQTSTGDSRSVDMSVYPAELIAGANVYKTADAALATAGLAGTIDTLLIDPLAFPSRVLAANYQKSRNSVGIDGVPEGKGERKSFTYIDQFFNRTVGVAVGVVKSNGSTGSTSQGGWGDGGPYTATLTDGTVVSGVQVPGFGNGIESKTINITDDRTGVAAIVAYKPNKNFTSQMDMFYAKGDTLNHQVWAHGGFFGGPNWNNYTITNATVVNGVATKGTWNMGAAPLNLIVRSESIFDDDTNQSFGWKNTLKMGNGWTGSLDLSTNSAKRTERDIEAYGSPMATAGSTMTFDRADGSQHFTLSNAADYVNPALMMVRNQAGWSGYTYPAGSPLAGQTAAQAGYDKGPTIIDGVDAIRFDFKKELAEGSMFSDVRFGLNYSSRSKDRSVDEALIVSTTGNGYDPIAYPGSYVVNNVGGTGLNLLTFNPTADLWPGATLLRKYNNDILSKSWGVKEKVTTAYAKATIDTEYAKVPVRGNVGVQVVGTNQSSSGYQAAIGSGVTLDNPAASGMTTAGKTYTDFLPSLNLTGDLGSGNLVRFGLAKEIARGSLTDLRNSFAANIDNTAGNATFNQYTGSAGNPNLDPFRATAIDLSYEKYFDKKAYVSAAVFYKKLDSYITTETNTAYDFTSYATALGLPLPAAIVGMPAPSYIGSFTHPVNGNGGNLNGIELAGSAPFSMLSSWLDGFGASGSYSTTNSSVKMPNTLGQNPTQAVPTNGQTISMPGLSKNNWKLTLYYEKNGFSAFVANNARSTYVGSVAGDAVGGYPVLRYIEGSSWLSAQIGYEIQEGPMKGLSFRAEGNNLNKPTYRQLNADGTVNNETKTGATLMFQVSYKL